MVYNKHDKLNNKAAKVFLLDSVDIKLQTWLKQCTLDAACDSHPFNICQLVQGHQETNLELTPSTVFGTGQYNLGW
jgi:hypothetical protein